MKNLGITFGRIAVTLAVLFVVSFLPLIPVRQAPVVPNAELYQRPAIVSLQALFGYGLFLMGESFRATWATWPAILGVTAAAVAGGWWLSSFVIRRRRGEGTMTNVEARMTKE